MKRQLIYIYLWIPLVIASIGDGLLQYKLCLQECYTLSCNFQLSNTSPSSEYALALADNQYNLNPLSSIFWNCQDNCNYKCQQIVTDLREKNHLPMVQFYGKWPFKRIWGIQEFFSVLFSMGNFYVSYKNLYNVLFQYNKNKKLNNPIYANITFQYLLLLLSCLLGWSFSSIFHFRDNGFTETLDYFGAFAIILLNFNAIAYRYWKVYDLAPFWQSIWKFVIVFIYLGHVIKLKLKWNYDYNSKINMFFGFSSMIMWILHSWNVYKLYYKHYVVYNNSIQLLPFETRILSKLNYLSISKSNLIPLIPIALNLWLLIGIPFEVLDFPPINRLLDAHALWHLITIFPTIIWYDWNIWDVELLKITNDLNKNS